MHYQHLSQIVWAKMVQMEMYNFHQIDSKMTSDIIVFKPDCENECLSTLKI